MDKKINLGSKIDADTELLAKVLANCRVNSKTGCRVWRRAKDPDGYGRLRWGKKVLFAHRAAYAAATGEDIDGLDVHHICGNRLCCNPLHLTHVEPEHHRSPANRSAAPF
jgi:hypothetical protein